MKTLVWLHGDSLAEQDPAAMKYPEAPRVFVFDRPFLEKAKLSFKRIFFLYECAAEAAQEIRVGETAEELKDALAARGAGRLAVTASVSPRWRELVEELTKRVEVEVVPKGDLVEVPADYEAKRFTPFWKKFGREWEG
ncbi:MAG: deoxyribodipyrimidine photo-lyase [Verrucomicrobia bacterium]|nr:deoxyribodipyrimidine photo-lyase [Verrucomicrobiota bacterium]